MKSPMSSGYAGASLTRSNGIHATASVSRGGMSSAMIDHPDVEIEKRSHKLMWSIIAAASIGAAIAIYFLR